MAHFDYLKPGGVWPLLSLLSSAIMEQIDRRLYKCINGDDGGVWSPTTSIEIGLAGMRVTGPFEALDATLAVPLGKYITVLPGATANFTIGSTFLLGGLTTMTGTFTVSGVGSIRIEDLLGLRVTGTGSMIVDQGGLVTVSPGGKIELGGAALNPGLIDVLQNGAIQLRSGGACVFLDGSTLSIAKNSGGGGGVFTMAGNMTVTADGVVKFQGTHTFEAGSYTSVGGLGPGHTTWDFGQYTLVGIATGCAVTDNGTWTRTGTETWNGANAGITFNGAGGGTTYNAFAGSEYKASSLLYIDSGADYRQRADNQRTGADLPSGTGAFQTKRVTTGSDSNMTITPTSNDVIMVPALSTDRTWTIASPADSDDTVEFTIMQKASAQGADLTIRWGSTTMALLIDDGDRRPGSITFQWADGALRVASHTEVKGGALGSGSCLEFP